VGKHYNNPQCFKEKTTKQNSQPAQYKKINSTKTILEKKMKKKFIKKKKKINHVGKHRSIP
jgi:CelD/BcsL family acetyltransferase involved in cellulose biosynthesis